MSMTECTVERLRKDLSNIIFDIQKRWLEAEENRYREYSAVVKIQSWFRGARVRAYLHHLHESVILIQKHWRGHLGRKKYRIVLKERVREMMMLRYFAMATRIQKTWRGYYVRKNIFSFYQRKEFLQETVLRNEEMRQRLQIYQKEMDISAKKKEKLKMAVEERDMLYKNHHLLSTIVKGGVYHPSRRKIQHFNTHLQNTTAHTASV